MKWVWAVALLVGACTTPNTTKACSAGSCLNPDFPYCDAEGVISGEPGTCIAVTCIPGEIETCLGDDALTCNATGDSYEHVPCELGCKATPTPHCGYIEPRYLPDVCDEPPAEESLVISSSGMFDPNLDSNCNGGIVSQTGGPGICVVRHRRIVIAEAAVLRVMGKPDTMPADAVGRAVALVADEELSVEGVLDVSAKGYVNGPGAGLVISGGSPQAISPGVHNSAGGAGGKTVGGAGGSTSADGGAANGGLAMADPALLAVFMGGAAAYGRSGDMFGGGGGGGAATLVSCRGTISVSGMINAGGGGGAGGSAFLGAPAPASAGGAGGYVVLQGKSVSLTGSMFANGGGGGGGTQANLAQAARGLDGLWSATSVASGGLSENGGGRGGDGGIGSRPPTAGGKPTMSGAGAAGGGGSVGFFQTYTPDGIDPALTPTSVSPDFQPNGTIKTR